MLMGRLARTSSQTGPALHTQVSREDTWPSHTFHLTTQGTLPQLAQPQVPPGSSGHGPPRHLPCLSIQTLGPLGRKTSGKGVRKHQPPLRLEHVNPFPQSGVMWM